MCGPSISRLLCSPKGVDIISLGCLLPDTSCSLPDAQMGWATPCVCLTLLLVGFAQPPLSPETLVVSYTTVSPSRLGRNLPLYSTLPSGYPAWPLANTMPDGGRTFLDSSKEGRDVLISPQPALYRTIIRCEFEVVIPPQICLFNRG